MTIRELETLKKFITGNNSFYNEIKNQKSITINNTVKFELIIIYAILNKKYLLELDENELLEIINSQDFTIEEKFLVYKSKCYSLDNLVNRVNKIADYKNKMNHGKIIPLNKQHDIIELPHQKNKDKKCKVYNFTTLKKDNYFTMRERSYIFERELMLDKHTLPYTEEVRKDFCELINYMIIDLLNDDITKYNIVYLKVLYSCLNLYPFTVYLKDKVSVPYEKLTFSQNEIGLRKTTHNNSYINEVENKILNLERTRQATKIRKITLEKSDQTTNKEVVKLQRKLFHIENEIVRLGVGIYIFKRTPEIYNENLINYIFNSFLQGNIEINKMFENPLIKIFYVKNKKVEFHCTMRLNTLMNLVDSNKILNLLTEGKKLKKEI